MKTKKTKTDKMRLVESAHGGKDIYDILHDAFATGSPPDVIAKSLGISRPCLYDWLDELSLEVRHTRSLSPKRGLVSA